MGTMEAKAAWAAWEALEERAAALAREAWEAQGATVAGTAAAFALRDTVWTAAEDAERAAALARARAVKAGQKDAFEERK